MELKGTKTEANLKAAFAGESQAHTKYQYFASKARKDGYVQVGNIFEDRLADVWITSMEAYRNYDGFSKCSRCKLKQFCRGCPAVAKGYSGDFYGDDPQCWASEANGLLTPKTEEQKNESCIA